MTHGTLLSIREDAVALRLGCFCLSRNLISILNLLTAKRTENDRLIKPARALLRFNKAYREVKHAVLFPTTVRD
jgi:hypothetical protein